MPGFAAINTNLRNLTEQFAALKAETEAIQYGVPLTENGKIDTDEIGPREQLLSMIIDSFNIDELKTLSFSVGVFWEHLAGDTLPVKAQSLIEFCERNGRLYILLDKCQQKKGHLEWPTL